MKILIVDDKPENLYLLELILKGSGFNTISGKNGIEALDMARKDSPDLIISDILMPDMDGFTLCRELKKDEELCLIPFIFYTATYTDPKDEDFALSLGADRFILKPKDPEEIVAVVEEVLKEHKQKNVQAIHKSSIPDQLVLKEYNEALVRKLEDKMLQAEQAEKEVRKFNIALLREIEERKQAEELLRKSERQISIIYDTVGESMFNLKVEKSGNYIFTSVNKCFLKTTGLKLTQIIGRSVNEIIPEPSLTMALGKYDEAIRERKIVRWEETSEYPTGQLIGSVSITPVFDENMNCINLVGSVHDITERKRAEKELLASEIKYRSFFENSMDAILLTSIDGKIISANPAACKLFGYSEAELIQLGRSGVVDITDPQLSTLLRQRESEGKAHGELTMIKKDGTYFPVEISSAVFRDKDGFERTSMIIRDISERKLAEKSLKDSIERYKKLTEISPVGIFHTDENGLTTFVNQKWCQISGLSSEKALGNGWLDAVHPDDRDKIIEDWNNATKLKTTSFSDYRFLHPDGKTTWVMGQSIPERNSVNQIIGYIGTITDITQRKQAEEEIQKANRVYAVLSNINQAIVKVKDNITLYSEACRIAVEDGKFRMAWIGIIDPKTNKVNPVASAGYTNDYLKTINIELHDEKLGQGPTGRSIKTGIHYLANDIANNSEMIPWRENALKLGYKSSAAFPIKAFDKPIGAFMIYAVEQYFFNDDEVKLLDEMVTDISFALESMETEKKRKEAEEGLRESEERFRNLFNASPDAVVLLDPSDNSLGWPIVDCNAMVCEMNGYTREELIGQSIDILNISPGSEEERKAYLKKIKLENVMHAESYHRHKDGHIFPIEISTCIVKVKGRELILGIDRDITQRKAIERTLAENEKLYEDLFDNAPVGYHELDSNGRISRINNTESNMLGFTKEEMTGQFVWKFVGDENLSRQRVLGKLKGMIPPSQDEERVYLRKDLTELQVNVKEIILHDSMGNIIGIRTTIQDISERKRAEEEIAMLAHSLRSINECVSVTDLEDNIIFVNESFLKTYGYNEDELIGKNMKVVRSLNNPPELVREILPATLHGGWAGELLNKKKDGSDFPIFLSTTVINDKEGKILGLIGVAMDVTDQKRTQKDLIEAKEKAERSDKLKTEFLAQMSHEIRTPIHIINGNVGYLNEVYSDSLDAEVKGCFEGIELASQRIIRTMDLILNYAEFQTSGYKPSFTQVDLENGILHPLLSEYKRVVEKKGLSVQYKNLVAAPIILADEYSIKQIFANLIDNAIKYTSEGKIGILIDRNDSENIFVQIKDTGIGMSKEFLTKLYEPFVQEEQGYSRSFDGNGLGLALVQKYCTVNNAIIVVESEKNSGSTFRITFSK